MKKLTVAFISLSLALMAQINYTVVEGINSIKESKVEQVEVSSNTIEYAGEINAPIEDGIEDKMSDDQLSTKRLKVTAVGTGEYVDAIDEDGNPYVLLNDGLSVGDIVEVKENQYGEVLEQLVIARS